MPCPRGEHEADERELGGERDQRGCSRQATDEDAHEQHATRDGQDVAGAREEDERVLRAQAEHVVDDCGERDVRRTDAVVRDRLRMPVGDHGTKSCEIALLVEPRAEHDARPAARGKEQEEPDGEEDEEAVDELGDPLRPGRRRSVASPVRHAHT